MPTTDPRTQFGSRISQSGFSRTSGQSMEPSLANPVTLGRYIWDRGTKKRKKYRKLNEDAQDTSETPGQRMKALRDYMASDAYAAHMRRKKRERNRRQPQRSSRRKRSRRRT